MPLGGYSELKGVTLIMRNNHFFYSMLVFFVSALGLLPSVVSAENWADKIQINGFSSFAYQRTNEAAFFNGKATESGIDKKGSFKGTKLGINISARINDRVRFASQLLANAEGDYNLNVDWAFVGITLAEPLTLRLGKVKYPVGIVNEYRDVGFAYPWITAPESVYSFEAPNGPQATRAAFNGASLLWEKYIGETTYSADFFGGEVALTGSDVRELKGLTLKANWDDQVLFQASHYTGTMANVVAPFTPAMNGQAHEVTTFGVKIDWNNYIVYAEAADVTMGTLTAMKADTSYITFGYRFGDFLPHITTQNYQQGEIDDEQTINKLGLRYELFDDTALKFEVGTIKTDKGQGLYSSTPSKSSASIYGFGVDVIF